MVTDSEIKKVLAEHGLAPEQLTSEEIASLRAEIEASKGGAKILDSVLDNPELFYRNIKRS